MVDYSGQFWNQTWGRLFADVLLHIDGLLHGHVLAHCCPSVLRFQIWSISSLRGSQQGNQGNRRDWKECFCKTTKEHKSTKNQRQNGTYTRKSLHNWESGINLIANWLLKWTDEKEVPFVMVTRSSLPSTLQNEASSMGKIKRKTNKIRVLVRNGKWSISKKCL